jgi:hypothetical protein
MRPPEIVQINFGGMRWCGALSVNANVKTSAIKA